MTSSEGGRHDHTPHHRVTATRRSGSRLGESLELILFVVVGLIVERQSHLLLVGSRTYGTMSRFAQHLVFASYVRLDDFRVVQRERQGVEHLSRTKLRKAPQYRLELGAVSKERKHASHGHTRARDVWTSAQDSWLDSDVGMGD